MKNSNSEIRLETKVVAKITGKFCVPSYQRGFRWSDEEITRLLDDIVSNGSQNYCLQPIVVKKKTDYYELIDGQQRLTTIYLIYKYMSKSSNGWIKGPHFSLSYETREMSEEFLSLLDCSKKDDDINFWFICNAYQTIEKWFSDRDPTLSAININKYLSENIHIIWYEVDESVDTNTLFTRLNIGKIPLTSAELVKAMFLSKSNANMDRKKQEEVSLQWGNIEKELQNDSLWYFLTNHSNAFIKLELI